MQPQPEGLDEYYAEQDQTPLAPNGVTASRQIPPTQQAPPRPQGPYVQQITPGIVQPIYAPVPIVPQRTASDGVVSRALYYLIFAVLLNMILYFITWDFSQALFLLILFLILGVYHYNPCSVATASMFSLLSFMYAVSYQHSELYDLAKKYAPGMQGPVLSGALKNSSRQLTWDNIWWLISNDESPVRVAATARALGMYSFPFSLLAAIITCVRAGTWQMRAMRGGQANGQILV